MVILGIETSCDETAVAIIAVSGIGAKPRVSVLSNVVSSQVKLHAKFGGVVPHLAKREHQRNLVPVLLTALKEAGLRNPKSEALSSKQIQNAKLKILSSILAREQDLFARMVPEVLPRPAPKIDAIAVTVGPGLAPALWVGVNFARALAFLWKKPLIPINHLEGHIYTNVLPHIRVNSKFQIPPKESLRDPTGRANSKTLPIPYSPFPIKFPALCLIVSGGHTELVLMRRYGDYRVIGETRDDAAGEAFDKVAKMMHLGFPGGPVISKLAESGNVKAFSFPRPMINSKDFHFSFSGLKTAVLYTLRGLKRVDAKTKQNIAASFERAVVDVLVSKTIRAARHYKVKTVMIGGGVAANMRLRSQLAKALRGLSPVPHTLFPAISLTGDNALMIALAGYFNRNKKSAWKNLQADANLRLDRIRGR